VGIRDLLRILWFLTILALMVFYLLILPFIMVLVTASGVLIWFVTCSVVLSEKGFRFLFKLLRVVMPGPSVNLADTGGSFLLKQQVKEYSWMNAIFREGVTRSVIPMLFLFGILNTILSRMVEAGIIKNLFKIVEVPILMIIIVLAPVFVAIVPVIWALIDSGWYIYDKSRNKIISVGDHLLIYMRGFASMGVLLGLLVMLFTRFSVEEAIFFVVNTLLLGGFRYI